MATFPLDFIVSAFATLFVVVDPIGLLPAYLAVTEGLLPTARRQVAWRACVTAAVILAAVAVGGDWLLAELGISLTAFRIAGGLLLFSIAFEMVFGVRIERQSKTAVHSGATSTGQSANHRRSNAECGLLGPPVVSGDLGGGLPARMAWAWASR